MPLSIMHATTITSFGVVTYWPRLMLHQNTFITEHNVCFEVVNCDDTPTHLPSLQFCVVTSELPQ